MSVAAYLSMLCGVQQLQCVLRGIQVSFEYFAILEQRKKNNELSTSRCESWRSLLVSRAVPSRDDLERALAQLNDLEKSGKKLLKIVKETKLPGLTNEQVKQFATKFLNHNAFQNNNEVFDLLSLSPELNSLCETIDLLLAEILTQNDHPSSRCIIL